MLDVTAKPATPPNAAVSSGIEMLPEMQRLIESGTAKKNNLLGIPVFPTPPLWAHKRR